MRKLLLQIGKLYKDMPRTYISYSLRMYERLVPPSQGDAFESGQANAIAANSTLNSDEN